MKNETKLLQGRIRWQADFIDTVSDTGVAYNVFCRDFSTTVVAGNEREAIKAGKRHRQEWLER